jgi:hypothetical protein
MEHRQILGEARGASFDTVAKADQAIRRLRAAGFADDLLLTACPSKFKDECACAMPNSESSSAGEAVGKGAVTGAAIGGLALLECARRRLADRRQRARWRVQQPHRDQGIRG